MRTLSYIIVSGSLLVSLTQCSKQETSVLAANPTCVPGETRACVGPGACEGSQACGDDGSSWSTCNCGSVAADSGAGGAASLVQDSGSVSDYILVDDMEGTAAQNGPIELSPGITDSIPGSWGVWYSTGSASNTFAPDPFKYGALSAPHETMSGTTSTHAAHVTCVVADLYGYCEEGFWLAQVGADAGLAPDAGVATSNVDARVAYDISTHSGFVFWGMSSLFNSVLVSISDSNTDAVGGHCGQSDAVADQCWDNFGTTLLFTDTWQRFEVKFADLQQEGWGYPSSSGKFDTSHAYMMTFEVKGPQSATAAPVAADFWVDDIYYE